MIRSATHEVQVRVNSVKFMQLCDLEIEMPLLHNSSRQRAPDIPCIHSVLKEIRFQGDLVSLPVTGALCLVNWL